MIFKKYNLNILCKFIVNGMIFNKNQLKIIEIMLIKVFIVNIMNEKIME